MLKFVYYGYKCIDKVVRNGGIHCFGLEFHYSIQTEVIMTRQLFLW
jgi:hypothetical protein